jgi:hypothetical protein
MSPKTLAHSEKLKLVVISDVLADKASDAIQIRRLS